MNPVRGIETLFPVRVRVVRFCSFKLMNPVRGIETTRAIATGNGKGNFQINESRSRD